MTGMFIAALDEDVARHLAVALRMYRISLKRGRYSEPPELEKLEVAALQAATKSHEASRGSIRIGTPDDDLNDRDFLSRNDVQRLTGASLSTIDRWISSGRLASRRQGRLRRVSRDDLDLFLAAA